MPVGDFSRLYFGFKHDRQPLVIVLANWSSNLFFYVFLCLIIFTASSTTSLVQVWRHDEYLNTVFDKLVWGKESIVSA